MDQKQKVAVVVGAGAAAVAAAPLLPIIGGVGSAAAIVGSIYAALQGAQEEIRAAEDSDAATLAQVAKKQQILAELQMTMSRVAQEVAIASRINHSESVEIEEFYDKSNGLKGEIGGSVKAQSIKVGGGSDSKDVVKRIYKFTGHAGAT